SYFASLNTGNNTHPEYKAPVSVGRDFMRYKPFNKKGIKVEETKTAGSLSMKAGIIVGLSSSGDTQFVAHYKNNKLKGSWISKFGENQLCDSGSLKNNIPNGEWKSWYPNGQLRYIRTYDAFRLEKTKQDISRRQSKSVTSPIAYIAKKNLRAAYSYLHPDYSFHTLAAQPASYTSYAAWMTLNERVSENIDDDALAYNPPFLECLHHGLYMNFYPDGAVKDSGYYKSGLRQGMWEEWLDDGATKSVGFYQQGHKIDTWKFYNKQGTLKYVKTYNREGREVSRKAFVRN
ncbi:MAG: hypothetical protein EOO04_38025, partial [Chitinophagaceae bacterium]